MTPVLVADLQLALFGRCGGLMAAAGLDGASAGSAWLEPLAASARDLGVSPASPLTVTDADLAGVTADQVSQLVDVAEVYAMDMALANMASPDQKVSLGELKYASLRDSVERTLDRKTRAIERRYGVGRGTITGGFVSLRFQERLRPGGCDDGV